jgi:hypothetical protein
VFRVPIVGGGRVCSARRGGKGKLAKRTEFGRQADTAEFETGARYASELKASWPRLWRKSDCSAPQIPPPRLGKSCSLRSCRLHQNLRKLAFILAGRSSIAGAWPCKAERFMGTGASGRKFVELTSWGGRGQRDSRGRPRIAALLCLRCMPYVDRMQRKLGMLAILRGRRACDPRDDILSRFTHEPHSCAAVYASSYLA